jgi:hypothetical protein
LLRKGKGNDRHAEIRRFADPNRFGTPATTVERCQPFAASGRSRAEQPKEKGRAPLWEHVLSYCSTERKTNRQ